MLKQFLENSHLFGGNAPYIEDLYESYLDNPGSVPPQWRDYFDRMQLVASPGKVAEDRDVAHAPIVESFAMRAKQGTLRPTATQTDLTVARKQVYVQLLIAAYRVLGSRWAQLDPLKRQERPQIPELEPTFYDLTETDMDTQFDATSLFLKIVILTVSPCSRVRFGPSWG